MRWTDRAKKILETAKTRTDRTDISPSVGYVGVTSGPFPEKNEIHGAERPFSLEPLPGRFWLDPIDNGFMPSAKTMTELSECKGYPRACLKCRLLMADMETCLLGPEGGDA